MVSTLSAIAAALIAARAVGALPDRFGTRRRDSRGHRTGQLLKRAGLDLSAGRFRALSGACGLAAFVLVTGTTGLVAVAVIVGLFAVGVPKWLLERRAARRQEEIQRAWPDAVRDVVASISAGLSLRHALERLGAAGPAALRPAFTRFALMASAVGTDAGLAALRDELADATSDRVIEVLLVANERGGPIVPEILRDLATATTRDLWVLEQVQTESLEQRINARAVFVLPWVVLVAITFQDGPFREFYRSPAGLGVILIGGAASVAGSWLVRRLGSQPTEPRVLGDGA